MGISYYALNHEKKTACELGKGGWANIWDALHEDVYGSTQVWNEEFIATQILKMIEEDCWAESARNIEYARYCAKAIMAVGYTAELVHDGMDNLYEGLNDYVIISSRFTERNKIGEHIHWTKQPEN